MENALDFFAGSSAFAADLARFTDFMAPLVDLGKGLSQLIGMFV